MKQIFAFGLALIASTGVASAHGFHAEVLEAAEHMQTHLIETGVSLVATVLVIAIGYVAYRKMVGTQGKE